MGFSDPAYPSWDSIESRPFDKEGGGGMCIHFSILLIQALQAYGIPARLQNCIYHEPVEAWSNDYGKWVFLDPMQGSNVYNYRKKDGEPLGFKELHDVYLDLFYPDRPIDCHTDPLVYRTVTRDAPSRGTLTKLAAKLRRGHTFLRSRECGVRPHDAPQRLARPQRPAAAFPRLQPLALDRLHQLVRRPYAALPPARELHRPRGRLLADPQSGENVCGHRPRELPCVPPVHHLHPEFRHLPRRGG